MPVFTSDVSVEATVGLTDTELRAVPVPVSGTIAVSNPGLTDTELRATPVPVSGTVTATGPLTDTQLRATPVPISGSVSTTPLSASSSVVTQVTSTGSNQTILASNVNRKKVVLFFNSGIWNVKLGAGASSTSRTYNISSSNTSIEISVWTGIIDAACTTAGKLVDVTELS